jgi:hypothetical protein
VTVPDSQGFKIGIVKVDSAYRGRGVANHLKAAARRDVPEGRVNPGWMTNEGYSWWKGAGLGPFLRYRGVEDLSQESS